MSKKLRSIDNTWDYEVSSGLSRYNGPRKSILRNPSYIDEIEYTQEFFDTHCECCGRYKEIKYSEIYNFNSGGGLCDECDKSMREDYHGTEKGIKIVSNPVIGDRMRFHLNDITHEPVDECISLTEYIKYSTPDDKKIASISTIEAILSESERRTSGGAIRLTNRSIPEVALFI